MSTGDHELRLNDWFCGAGGATQGAHAIPGVVPLLAANHDDLAIATHSTNFPDVEHFKGDIRDLDVATHDTIQGGARERIREEERAKVADQIKAANSAEDRWRDHFAQQTEHMRALLDQVNGALGCRVVDHDNGSLTTAGPARLAELGSLLGHHSSLQRAVEELAGRYGGASTDEVRKAVDHLDDALRRAREGLPPRRDRW